LEPVFSVPHHRASLQRTEENIPRTIRTRSHSIYTSKTPQKIIIHILFVEKVATMGIFTRKDKTAASVTSGKNSSLAETLSIGQSSTSSLKSPTTPGYPKTMPLPTIPKIELPKAPDPSVDPAGYLRSIGAVRERCALVMKKAHRNELKHFEVDMGKFADTTSFVVSIIKVCCLSGAQLKEELTWEKSATLPPITRRFLPMGDGSISMSADEIE